MLTEQDMQELIAWRSEHLILSVYLNVDPSFGSADRYKLRLRQMLKEFEARSPADVEAVERFVDHEYDWSGRTLVMFSCQAADFFRHYSLAIPTRSQARLADSPYMKPLVDMLDSYGDYGIVVVDKQGARVFHFHLGSLREQEGMLGEAVRHTKRGGGSQAAGRRGGTAGQTRYTEEVTGRNLKEAARFAANFFQDNRVRRVLIGGTEANVAHFSALLPKTWQSLVMGTFPVEMTAGHAQVLDKAMEVAHEAERDREARLVDAVITAAAKGQEGVIGLGDTLSAVYASRVQTLVVSEGFHAPGFRCLGCGHLSAEPLTKCPFCGGETKKIDDAVELAIGRVMAEGGEIEVIHDSPALEKAGRIGGLLRY